MSASVNRPATRVPAEPYRRPDADRPDVLRLDGNEGSYPPAALLDELRGLDPSVLRDYPDLTGLQSAIAAWIEVPPEQVVVTAGADDAIDRCFRAFLGSDRELILPVPTFEMMFRFAAMAGGRVVTVPWTGPYPTDEVMARVGPQTALIAVVTPNNPTGLVATAADITRLAEAAPHTLVLVDHVYVDYADVDLTRTVVSLSNAVLTRTFSKAWGLAGCRVGFAVASPDIANTLRNAGNPFPVASLSIAVARRHLESQCDTLADHVIAVRAERESLRSRLESWNIPVTPSQGNFVFADFGERVDFVRDALAVQGILVRHFPHRAEIAHGLRISLPGRSAAFARLTSSLETILAPDALCFDLDGVVADVTNSYRRCITETAHAFGCEITADDIQEAKRRGNANNDWQLTHRLLAERGVDASLAEVTSTYQARYLGSAVSPGLREGEQPLVTRDQWRDLAARLPLAVVTGRPREEAEWFLRRFGLRDQVKALVCLEDAPIKPDPAPVRLALERLGAKHAWMIGDTPDDMVAATAAGVVPIGVIAPHDDTPAATRALRGAGAAAVLTTIDDIWKLLP